jgi:argininosuccinate lyase
MVGNPGTGFDAESGRMTLWERRLGEPAPQTMALSASLSFDKRLAPDDIVGSRAHVRGLARGGLLTAQEAATLLAALDRVSEELESGQFVFKPGDEDIHTALERRLTEMAGDVGAKLHTGRSRNDQVATDLRLYTRRQIVEVVDGLLALERVLVTRAAESEDAYLPGYTHMQRAQPVLLAHHLLAHGWAFSRDVDRLFDTLARMDVSPLGAGALAGSSLSLDPDGVAEELGFRSRFENSLDAVSDRDFVAEMLFCLALLGVHLSRLGEEIVIWSTEEFGFARLDDAFATGSSMLPQKKNPDIAELARGKSGRLIGHLTGLLVTLKGLPLSYNRDLQEDKEPLFDSVDQIALVLPALTGLLETLTFDVDRMRAAADGPAAAASDLAEWMVEKGIPFRKAHGIVASVVRDAIERGVPLEELVSAHPDLGEPALALLEPGVAVTRRTTDGGAGPGPVKVQLERFRTLMELDEARFTEAVERLGEAASRSR